MRQNQQVHPVPPGRFQPVGGGLSRVRQRACSAAVKQHGGIPGQDGHAGTLPHIQCGNYPVGTAIPFPYRPERCRQTHHAQRERKQDAEARTRSASPGNQHQQIDRKQPEEHLRPLHDNDMMRKAADPPCEQTEVSGQQFGREPEEQSERLPNQGGKDACISADKAERYRPEA